MEVQLHSFFTQTLDELSRQIHAPAAVSCGKSQRQRGGWVGLQGRFDLTGEHKSLLPVMGY